MNKINQYSWAISLCITLLGWVWVMAGERAVTQLKLDELDTRLTRTQKQNQMLNDKLMQIHNSLIQVKTDVRWLRQSWANNRHTESQNHDQ